MILFFDRSIGTRIPKALRLLNPSSGIEIHFHDQHFKKDAPDDQWLPYVGSRGWIVVGFDYRLHINASELAALRQYDVGCFYLWGANDPRWEAFRVFARAFDRIVERAIETPRPFVYRVERSSRLQSVKLS